MIWYENKMVFNMVLNCQVCGIEIGEKDKFCKNCGENLATERTNEVKKSIDRYSIAFEHFSNETQISGQIFQSFLLANTVFSSILLQGDFGSGQTNSNPLGVFMAGIVGLFLCITWAISSYRSYKLFNVRQTQVKEAEPEGWNLLTNYYKFVNEGSVEIGTKPFRMNWLERLFQQKVSLALIIIAFLMVYFFIVVVTAKPAWAVFTGLLR
ncbi:MAG: zinc ribbon domain-containing protein [Candidatus Methanoperedens sp.]